VKKIFLYLKISFFENKIKISAIKKPFNEFALSQVNKSEIKKLIIKKKPKI